jgi:hypothetical protein
LNSLRAFSFSSTSSVPTKCPGNCSQHGPTSFVCTSGNVMGTGSTCLDASLDLNRKMHKKITLPQFGPPKPHPHHHHIHRVHNDFSKLNFGTDLGIGGTNSKAPVLTTVTQKVIKPVIQTPTIKPVVKTTIRTHHPHTNKVTTTTMTQTTAADTPNSNSISSPQTPPTTTTTLVPGIPNNIIFIGGGGILLLIILLIILR